MLALSVASLAALACAAPWLHRYVRPAALFALVPAAVCAGLVLALAALPAAGARAEAWPWYPELGGELAFRLDAFGGLLAVLVTGVGALIVVYASAYLKGHPAFGRFLLHLFGFMAAMLGLALADNVILLFVFWELTSVTSYLLIGFNHEDKVARGKALQALLVTGIGGVALLAGLLLLSGAAGTMRVSEIVATPGLAEAPHYAAFTILILLGAFAKSAQFPLHFWLPNAMAAPAPVSAFLHSATMVKAGVFLLTRLSPALDGTALWHGTLLGAGAITLLLGAGFGLVQSDLKRILAYTTLAILGTLTLLLGIGTELALQSLVLLLVGHALYKAALFMVAGTIDHETGTRDLSRLGGLARAMPYTAAAGTLAALSGAGFPPFFGFIGKEYVYKTSAAAESLAPAIVGIALAANVVLLALALKAGWHPFWARRPSDAAVAPHEGSPGLWVPPLLLALAGLGLGALPGWSAHAWVGPAISALAREPVELELALWHGFNLPLLLSAVTVAGGLTLYARRRSFWPHAERVAQLDRPAAFYERALQAKIALARGLTTALQNGRLRSYVAVTLATTSVLLAWKFIRFGGWTTLPPIEAVSAVPAALCGGLVIAALVAAGARTRLGALLALGIVGLTIALLFGYYSAPDLAITQIMVEALTIILLVAVVYRLPPMRRERGSARAAILAAVFGGLMGLLVLGAMAMQIGPSIAPQLSAWSYPEAHGRNVVNVILVDFRALDTLGEIVVLAIAGLGVFALLQRTKRKEDRDGA